MTSSRKKFEVRSLIFSFVVIAICEAFFLIDVSADIFRIDINTSWIEHDKIELFSTVTLALSLVVIGLQIVRLLKAHRQARDVVEVASGELLAVIMRHFEDWKLSASEREVALLLIKGLSTQEIADLRQTKIGTVSIDPPPPIRPKERPMMIAPMYPNTSMNRSEFLAASFQASYDAQEFGLPDEIATEAAILLEVHQTSVPHQGQVLAQNGLFDPEHLLHL